MTLTQHSLPASTGRTARRAATRAAAVSLLALAPLLAACSSDTAAETSASSETSSSSASSESTQASDATESSTVTLVDGWAKAGETGGMTGLFGTLTNSGTDDLTITGVTSDASDMVELHEVTEDGVMQEIDGDVVIPAEGTFELAPGANHIMLMGLTRDLLAGDEVSVTLSFDNGETAEFTVLVKDYAGANETYNDSDSGEH